MNRKHYDSDLTDTEFAILEPLLPARKARGRPRSVVLHEILDAIFYILRGGVPWRMLPDGLAAGMDRQTLRDWVHRDNAEGLSDRRRPGPRPRLSPEQEAELVTAVEQGPDPDRDGVVRWRRVDLRALIETRFAVRLHERSVGKVL